MKKIGLLVLSLVFVAVSSFAQQKETQQGHTNQNKFKQLKDVLATPTSQRTASGAPGKKYTQQKVDYAMNIYLDDDKETITGSETITYHNNSEDELPYLWLQLDQNMRAADSKTPDIQPNRIPKGISKDGYQKTFEDKPFDGGFKITSVTNVDGSDLSYTINQTMMRINLAKPLAAGEKFQFKIKWWYKINNHRTQGGRSGFEHFPDGNNNYVIAQFYPRLCVYDNVEGWQNDQFWGRSEFALEFGDFNVNITTPDDHMLGATGRLLNEKQVLTRTQLRRLAEAKKSFKDPVVIQTQKDAEKVEKKRSKRTKTWKFFAENVRDFAFASSRKFIWDGMAVDINGRTVMAYSYYSKEANSLYGDHSTRAAAQTLKTYSKYTFDYPYHKAISVDGQMGMEYPMIAFNPGRPNADGTYSDRTKYRMLGTTIHEVGHNFFPMIVNSDERQWTWMDEGLNSFMQMLAMRAYEKDYPLSRGLPKNIVRYMSGDQSRIAPIMSKGDNVYSFGSNAYAKPATALWILRETIMGHELFDHAFRTYSQRWMFKHPTPADFFRSMEDASGIDLDWFWRGWFYTTDVTDIGIKSVKKFYAKSGDNDRVEFTEDTTEGANFNKEKGANSKYFYEITFDKPGGLVMPIIVEFTYKDGTKERKTYPAQIWRLNDKQVTKAINSDKEITNITVDPDLETADVDMTNNSWPKKQDNKFGKFKKKIKG
ncbi:Aminopeptidase N [Polaribacter huanghezhanensis]|uniref:M1 family metallopeptidase n=1 Tax=Polaribacter huanghezhanensis TaxID=1354726 RepID=UPI002648D79C|nr:M1 family metallopeptidase [Polaribacter huanghezhanensis]WKD86392.1 Aminopeptidase N [Polaribacter huanghezhanensis]